MGDIHDVRLALEGAFETTVPHTTTEQRPNALVVSTLAVAAAAIAVAGWLTLRPEPIAPPRLATRFRIAMPPNQLLINRSGNADGSSLALSPDGSRLVYSARQGADNIWWQLYTRSSDRLDAVPVRDGQVRSSVSPFFSPSGDWIGFERDGKIMKVPAGGGAVLEVCDVPSFSGATWLPDDSIVFGTTAGLMRVSAVGGTPTPLTKPDGKTDSSHRWPAALPGGKAIVFSIQRPGTNFNGAAIGVLRLDTGQWTVLVEGGTAPHYLPSGHLAFVRNGVMLAMPFDVRTLQASGTAVPLVDGIFESVSQGSAKLAVANTGTIAYVPAQTQQLAVAMVWVDRHGAVEPVPALHQTYETPRLSPDGQRVAVAVNNAASTGDRDIWLYDISRATLSRFTTGTTAQAQAETPAWTPDGRRVTYATGPVRQFVWKAADGSGTAELLASTDRHLHSGSWSPSGDAFISAEVPSGASRTSATRSDGSVWIMHKGATWTLDPYLKTAFPIRGPVISPDGRWLAYTSSDNNRSEIYVQTFPKPGGKSLVSTDGGTEPVWARNGRELFYRSGDKMMAVSVDNSGSTPKIGKPTLLFQGSFAATGSEASYDVSVDGQRFLMLKSDDAATSESIVVIQDWMNEVKALVSRGK